MRSPRHPVRQAGDRPPRPTARRLAAAAASAALGLGLLAGPAAASGAPTGLYAGMGGCPLNSAALKSAGNAEIGCAVATVTGGSFTIGSTVVTLPSTAPITASFGIYFPNGGPVQNFPDGSSAELFSTVAPTSGAELTAAPINVPIPGLADFWPGVTSAITQIELAGPITNFAPLAAGEDFPLFEMPIKLHLENVFLGPSCYVGSNSAPVVLEPTSGTTSPPAPNKPVSGNPGTISINADPNGFSDAVVGFSGASLVDNAFAVPGASGCGPLGLFDPIIDALFGLPSAAGHNAVTFASVDSSIAVDSSVADLAGAIAASEK